ncbi:MAG TPA: ABC transporter substrate binding protein [Candidatus Binatia bacterium]
MQKAAVSSILVVVILLAGTVIANAQRSEKIFRIGFLDSSTPSGIAVLVDALRQELRKLGWTEGKNVIIEFRYAEQKPDRLPQLAAELVRLNVDVIVAPAGPSVLAAKEATKTIPIVMTNPADPVGEGMVASLAQPGGNVTGLSSLGVELNTQKTRDTQRHDTQARSCRATATTER